MDEDPLCDCQDNGGFRLMSVGVVRRPAGRAAAVRFVIGVVPVVVRLDLVRIRGGWRVANVHSRDMPSLVSLLEGAGTPDAQAGGFLVPPGGRL